MSLLYKRCNGLWAWLIRRRLVGHVWRPLVAASRRRHLRYRARLRGAARAPGGLGRGVVEPGCSRLARYDPGSTVRWGFSDAVGLEARARILSSASTPPQDAAPEQTRSPS
ncbi:MAG: hypothetical protein R3F30_09840 [Planctomycetota bacterium]